MTYRHFHYQRCCAPVSMPSIATSLYHAEPQLQSLISVIGRCTPADGGDWLTPVTGVEVGEVQVACQQMDLAFTLPPEWAQLAPATKLDLRISHEDWVLIAGELVGRALLVLEPIAAALQLASQAQQDDWASQTAQPASFARWRKEQDLVAIPGGLAVNYLVERYPENAAQRAPFPVAAHIAQARQELGRHKMGLTINTTAGDLLVCKRQAWMQEIESAQVALRQHAKLLASMVFRMLSIDPATDLSLLEKVVGLLPDDPGLEGMKTALASLQEVSQPGPGLQSRAAKALVAACVTALGTWTAPTGPDADTDPGWGDMESEALDLQAPAWVAHPVAPGSAINSDNPAAGFTTTSTIPDIPGAVAVAASVDAIRRPRHDSETNRPFDAIPVGPTTRRVDPSAIIGEGVTISATAVVGARARLQNRVHLGVDVVVGRDATIAEGVRVPANLTIAPGAVLSQLECFRYTKFKKGTVLGGNLVCRSKVYLSSHFTTRGACQLNSTVRVKAPLVFSDGAIVSVLKGCENLPAGTEVGGNIMLGHGCTVATGVRLGAEVKIGNEVVIESGARIGNQVIVADKVRIGAGAWIGSGLRVFTHVPANAVVRAEGTTVDGRAADPCAGPVGAIKLLTNGKVKVFEHGAMRMPATSRFKLNPRPVSPRASGRAAPAGWTQEVADSLSAIGQGRGTPARQARTPMPVGPQSQPRATRVDAIRERGTTTTSTVPMPKSASRKRDFDQAFPRQLADANRDPNPAPDPGVALTGLQANPAPHPTQWNRAHDSGARPAVERYVNRANNPAAPIAGATPVQAGAPGENEYHDLLFFDDGGVSWQPDRRLPPHSPQPYSTLIQVPDRQRIVVGQASAAAATNARPGTANRGTVAAAPGVTAWLPGTGVLPFS
ncbi:MAG: UDP-3-O-[3-hydroxymyristoyl] glucosamine N-acyltransferase [Paucimonas sp.]|nr:UDP-3-O-[3-hydroxymyristoyl] glucosamine N-acyltransferase [Paucimonas sp.]